MADSDMTYDYDYDGADNGLPPVEAARGRLIAFISQYGDGVVETVVVDYRKPTMHDLHTRDIEAVVAALGTS